MCVALVRTFHQAMLKSAPSAVLPKWYLMDSICKNVGGAYIAEFSQFVVPLFCDTFDRRPDMRERLAKLLRLWDGGMSFHGGLVGVLIAVL